MRKIKLSGVFLLLALFLMTSCEKEEEPEVPTNDCPLSSWLGDYTGTESIDGAATTDIEFSAKEVNTGSFQVVITGESVGDFVPESCTETIELDFNDKKVHTMVLDGNKLTWTKKTYDSNDVLEETIVRTGTK